MPSRLAAGIVWKHSLWRQTAWFWTLVPLLTSCATADKLNNFSELISFNHDNNGVCFISLMQVWNKSVLLKCLKESLKHRKWPNICFYFRYCLSGSQSLHLWMEDSPLSLHLGVLWGQNDTMSLEWKNLAKHRNVFGLWLNQLKRLWPMLFLQNTPGWALKGSVSLDFQGRKQELGESPSHLHGSDIWWAAGMYAKHSSN